MTSTTCMKSFSFFYILGAWQRSVFGEGDSIAMQIAKWEAEYNIVLNLNFKTHPGINNNSPVYIGYLLA